MPTASAVWPPISRVETFRFPIQYAAATEFDSSGGARGPSSGTRPLSSSPARRGAPADTFSVSRGLNKLIDSILQVPEWPSSRVGRVDTAAGGDHALV